MIVVLTPNPALDTTWTLRRLIPGESHRVETGLSRAGGKGINVARILHGEAHNVVAITAAPDTGPFLPDLAASGVPHRIIPVRGPIRQSFTIVDGGTGEATVLNERGARLDPATIDRLVRATLNAASERDIVAISGSLPPGFSAETLGSLVGELRLHDVRTVVDTSGEGILAAAAAGATVLKPNQEELATATQILDPIEGARSLIALGALTVVVSMGADGLAIVRQGHPHAHIRARLPIPLIGNPTGAGDAVVAAICHCLAVDPTQNSSRSWIELARRAVAWSGSAVLAPQAGSLDSSRDTLLKSAVVAQFQEQP